MGAIYTNTRPSMQKRKPKYWTGYSFSNSFPGKETVQSIPLGTFYGNQGYKDGTFVALQDTVKSYRTKDDVSNLKNDSSAARALLDEQIRKNTHDTGHEFDLRKFTMQNPLRIMSCSGPAILGGYYSYKGPMGLFSFDPVVNRLTDFGGIGTWAFDLNVGAPADPVMGTKAIASASPVKRHANLAAAITEVVRDGMPSIPGRALRNASASTVGKAGGEEFLNFIFGWVPTIKDVQDLLKAMARAPKILNQYARDSDKIVRRRFAFPPTDVTKYGTQSYNGAKPIYFIPGMGGGSQQVGNLNSGSLTTGVFRTKSGGSLTMTAVETAHTQVWFSGAFRYHMTIGDDVFSRMNRTAQKASVLLGLRLDLETFYTAFPWSWIVDWFADVGDIVRNGSRQQLDGQVLQYGYLMQHDVLERTFTAQEPVYFMQGSRSDNLGNPTITYVSQRKQRIRATPFGFGLNPNTFTAQQWAILGALGLTKRPNVLW